MKRFILAIDQGTSSTKSIIFDEKGIAIAKGMVELKTSYLENGFVEQDAEAIYQNVIDSASACLHDFKIKGHNTNEIASCGISNQRETFMLWDISGKALTPAIVWACKRSIDICQNLIQKGQNSLINERTGLIIDPYFSATKLIWLLENNASLKEKVKNGEVYFGTVDTWLLWKMTNGSSFKTDFTNASRTLLFNIHNLNWDIDILKLWGLEKLNLPEVCPSSHDFGIWNIEPNSPLNLYFSKLKITALIGDSHAAAFGEGCFEKGSAKATLGTGCSIMMNIGPKPINSKQGMLTTICWSTENRIDYALEGAIVSCGSTVEWLKNSLNLFDNVAETEKMAVEIPDTGGVYLIPSFSGLGAPHWQMSRKASLEGMTFGTTKNHIVRAALESIPYQIKDVIVAMEQDFGGKLMSLAVNGGLTKNQFVIQFLVGLLNIELKMNQNTDVSALGAAYLSGLKSGVYKNIEQIKEINTANTGTILPTNKNEIALKGYQGWLEKIRNFN